MTAPRPEGAEVRQVQPVYRWETCQDCGGDGVLLDEDDAEIQWGDETGRYDCHHCNGAGGWKVPMRDEDPQ